MLGRTGYVTRTQSVDDVKEVSTGRFEAVGCHDETIHEACLVIDDAVPAIEGKRPPGLVRVVVWRSDGMQDVREVPAESVNVDGGEGAAE